jgi:ABC-type sugar transport system permease subunit
LAGATLFGSLQKGYAATEVDPQIWKQFSGTNLNFISENTSPSSALAADIQKFVDLTGIHSFPLRTRAVLAGTGVVWPRRSRPGKRYYAGMAPVRRRFRTFDSGRESWLLPVADRAETECAQSWWLTLIYFVSTVGFELVFGVGVALLVYELVWGRNLILSLLLRPMFIAPVVVGLIGEFMLDPVHGLYSWMLRVTSLSDGNILGHGPSAFAGSS